MPMSRSLSRATCGGELEIHHVEEAEALLGSRPMKKLRATDKQRHEREILVDGRDAQIERILRRLEMHRLAVDEIFAGGGRVHARQRLDERGFAGAVVAKQAVHFAALQAQCDAVQRDDLAEKLADVFEREDVVAS